MSFRDDVPTHVGLWKNILKKIAKTNREYERMHVWKSKNVWYWEISEKIVEKYKSNTAALVKAPGEWR